MKTLKKGNLGCYAGNGDKNMPTNGETFIDARNKDETYLVVSCGNCGDYSYIGVKTAKKFINFARVHKKGLERKGGNNGPKKD